MKKVSLLIALIFMVAIVKAQNGTKYFSLRGGWVAESAYIGTLSYDFNTRYFNQNEVFAEYYQDYKNPSIKTFMGGFAVKPVLFRSKNKLDCLMRKYLSVPIVQYFETFKISN